MSAAEYLQDLVTEVLPKERPPQFTINYWQVFRTTALSPKEALTIKNWARKAFPNVPMLQAVSRIGSVVATGRFNELCQSMRSCLHVLEADEVHRARRFWRDPVSFIVESQEQDFLTPTPPAPELHEVIGFPIQTVRKAWAYQRPPQTRPIDQIGVGEMFRGLSPFTEGELEERYPLERRMRFH